MAINEGEHMHMGLWHKGIDGQVFGKGIGLTWDEAKIQAAEKALGSLRTMLSQGTQKQEGFPRSVYFQIKFGWCSTSYLVWYWPIWTVLSQYCPFSKVCVLSN